MLIVGNGRLISRSKISPYLENGALALDGDTVKETSALEAMRAKYPDAEFVDARACAYATVLDCIRDGVPTIFDHHASFGEIPGSLFTMPLWLSHRTGYPRLFDGGERREV